jgi:hypothetical protein
MPHHAGDPNTEALEGGSSRARCEGGGVMQIRLFDASHVEYLTGLIEFIAPAGEAARRREASRQAPLMESLLILIFNLDCLRLALFVEVSAPSLAAAFRKEYSENAG